MKKTFKLISFILIGLFSLAFLYVFSAFALSRICLNTKVTTTAQTINCYIVSNGVHTDLVLPTNNEFIDWHKTFSPQNTLAKNTNLNWIAIGWGDKGFYLETPTWSDLKTSTAFKAMFGLGNSAIHVTYLNQPKENEKCKLLKLSNGQYKKLITYILSSISKNNETPIWIKTDATYGQNDAFYEAEGSYSIFKTCNTWTNCGLKESNATCAFWTPFASGVLRHYK